MFSNVCYDSKVERFWIFMLVTWVSKQYAIRKYSNILREMFLFSLVSTINLIWMFVEIREILSHSGFNKFENWFVFLKIFYNTFNGRHKNSNDTLFAKIENQMSCFVLLKKQFFWTKNNMFLFRLKDIFNFLLWNNESFKNHLKCWWLLPIFKEK